LSSQELHDLLVQLEQERSQLDPVYQEQHQRLEELVESLEQQKLYPDDFDQFSALASQVKEMVSEFEANHPSVAAVLDGISRVLQNFKA
jgi:septal ring factor EnvC (AmiA/AmiB activator)